MGQYDRFSKEELMLLLEARDLACAEEKKITKHTESASQPLFGLTANFKHFFDYLPIGVILYDRDGYLLNANNTGMELFGTTLDKVKGINLFQNPSLTPEIKKKIINSKEGFTLHVTYNSEIIKKSGYYETNVSRDLIYLQARGQALDDPQQGRLGYLLTFSDDTETKLKTEFLKDNLAIVKAIILNRKSMIGVYDWERDAIHIDPKLNDNLSDCSLAKFVQDNWMHIAELREYSCFKDKEDWENSPFYNVLQGRLDQCSFDCYITIQDNTTWVRFNAVAYSTKTDTPKKIICYLRDITDQKRLEETLRLSKEKSRQVKLEMLKAREADSLKSAFLANMSHEIRTPLNAIVGFSSLLLESEDEEEKRMYAEIITKNNDLLLRLVTDILDFSKIEAGTLDYNFSDVNIKDILFEQNKVHSLKMPEGVKLICDISSLPDVRLHTDAKRLTQVISNLLSNAVKFTIQGSVILSYTLDANTLTIQVTDTGIGIFPDKLDEIFNRFVKVDSFYQGTGLGLTICKTIVEALGGTIGVKSTIDVGSCFWFTLPCGKK